MDGSTKNRKKKPQICQRCGSTKIADIVYGLPAYDEELERYLNDGKIILGGCCFSKDSPQWECCECHAQFFKQYDC